MADGAEVGVSTAKEVRAALTKQPSLSPGEILEACSGDVNTKLLATVLKQMLDRGEVTREGTPGAFIYDLVPGYKGGRGSDSTPPPKASKPAKAPKEAKAIAPAARTKSQRTAAKVQRKTAVSVPVRVEPDDNHVVALQADGSVFLLDKSDGTYQSLPPGVVRQIMQLSSLRAG
jgi:hypothetical protein